MPQIRNPSGSRFAPRDGLLAEAPGLSVCRVKRHRHHFGDDPPRYARLPDSNSPRRGIRPVSIAFSLCFDVRSASKVSAMAKPDFLAIANHPLDGRSVNRGSVFLVKATAATPIAAGALKLAFGPQHGRLGVPVEADSGVAGNERGGEGDQGEVSHGVCHTAGAFPAKAKKSGNPKDLPGNPHAAGRLAAATA
jgi:hypothetical protein